MSNDSNERDGTVTVRGGVTQLQIGDPLTIGGDPRQAARDMLRQGVDPGGAIRIGADGNVEQHGGNVRVQMGIPEGTDNPMDSPVTPWGSAASRITPDTYLNFSGQRIQARTAVALGWLRVNVNGDYQSTGRHVGEVQALQGQR